MDKRFRVLSVVIPVFNEEKTIAKTIDQVLNVEIEGLDIEIIAVNDGSNDNTAEQLDQVKDKRVRVINLEKNRGKGAAIQEALKIIKGDLVIIQDADLEYDPCEYPLLLSPILSGKADVVFGSRFAGSGPHRVLYFWHMVGNKFLTLVSNAMTNLNLTDVNTCYKAFTAQVAEKIQLRENRFGFDPEFTAKIAKYNFRIYEVGISYFGRSYSDGKKITWKDGFRHLYCMFKYRYLD